MTRRHLISTTATDRTCPRCHAPILTALDEGLPATIDREPIAATTEVAILLTGRRTYTKTHGGQLIHRTPERIRGGWLRGGTIHAEHKCDQPPSEQLTFDLTGGTQ